MVNQLIKLVIGSVFIVVIIIFTIILVRAFDSRKLPDLKIWHQPILESEYSAANSNNISSLDDYLELEDRLFTELKNLVNGKLPPEEQLPLSRYTTGSLVDPEEYSQNWNRSFELIPENMRGGVLMLHGLTDSPYSTWPICSDRRGSMYSVSECRVMAPYRAHCSMLHGMTGWLWFVWVPGMSATG